jgi:hypothetical protein
MFCKLFGPLHDWTFQGMQMLATTLVPVSGGR